MIQLNGGLLISGINSKKFLNKNVILSHVLKNISIIPSLFKKTKTLKYSGENDSLDEELYGPLLHPKSNTNKKTRRKKEKIDKAFQNFNPNGFFDIDVSNIDQWSSVDSRLKFENKVSRIKQEREFSFNRIREMTGNPEPNFHKPVSNTYWKDVPSEIDINAMINYPLFNNNRRIIIQNEDEKLSLKNNQKEIKSVHIFENGYKKIPSVSKILNETMPIESRLALERWKQRMIKELGEEGFKEYSKELLQRGKLLHECIESQVTGMEPDVENLPTIAPFWKSLKNVFHDISDVEMIESRIIHPDLHYQGVVDCVAKYKGRIALIDWKTSKKPKSKLKATFDDPLQLAAYLGAMNFDPTYHDISQVRECLLVVAYESGLPAHCHMISREICGMYWRVWCQRLASYWRHLETTNK